MLNTSELVSRRSFVSAWLAGTASFPAFADVSGRGPARVGTPNGGIQPQAVVDANDVVHLVYLTGDPAAADVFYVQRPSGGQEFSKQIRASEQAGSAIAIGTVRGAHLAIGRAGRIHVAWNGSSNAVPKGPRDSSPILYTRLNESGTAFEPARNLMQRSYGLDGGGTVSADTRGHVYVTWHGQDSEEEHPVGEASRRVWIAVSNDDGKTFSPEVAVSPLETGVCGCCGMGVLCHDSGSLYLLYRSAQQLVHRDMHLLASRDGGKTFAATKLDTWRTGACPMSTVSFTEFGAQVFAAWEKEKQVYFTVIDTRTGTSGRIIEAPGSGPNRKHPSMAVDRNGDVFLAWTEGTGWKRGGIFTGQRFDGTGKPFGEPMPPTPIPAWDFATAIAPRRGFEVIS